MDKQMSSGDLLKVKLTNDAKLDIEMAFKTLKNTELKLSFGLQMAGQSEDTTNRNSDGQE